MSSIFCCGFEEGILSSDSPHWLLAGDVSISTSTVRSGKYSARFAPASSGAAIYFQQTAIVPIVSVHRYYIYFEALPNQNTFVFYAEHNTSRLGVVFKSADSKLYTSSGESPTPAGTGFAVTTGEWYQIDIVVDQTSGARTLDAQVNSNLLSQATNTGAHPIGEPRLGPHNATTTGVWYVDDYSMDDDAGNYPIGVGFINGFIPSQDGTHNIAGANQFERGTTGTDITNATTDAYQLIDDVPMDVSPPSADDYVSAIAPANATDYVEVKFAIIPGGATPEVGPRAVEVIVATHETNNNVGNSRLALVDNATVDDVKNDTRAGVTAIRHSRKHYIEPPSAAVAWHVAGDNSDGDFLNLRMRFYSSDANPDQHWDGALIEADFGEADVPDPPPTGGYYACAGTLPTFSSADQAKITELRDLYAAGDSIGQVFELVKVHWPEPTDPVYYSVLQVDEVASVAPPVSPIEVRIPFDGNAGNPDWFLGVDLDASIGDEEIDLELYDGDGAISDLMVLHGEGIKVEVMYWFPEVELLLSIWHGHLRQEDEATIDICKVKAVQGFRSSDGLLPRRAHYRECQAIFGGVFDTQAEIDEHHDCPYNKQIPGGTTGNFESGSTPFTSCPRRTRADCTARLGNDANFMLSHATVSVTIPNGQTKGPLLYSTSNGNETNLKDPVPVVMGTRRVHNAPVMVGRKDFNNNHPDDAWYVANYELCEGPVVSISNIRVTVQGETKDPADSRHILMRLGAVGQTPVDSAITPHSYSGTVHLRYAFGWINPAEMGDADASASAVVVGLNNVRIYTDETTYTEEYTDNRAWHLMEMLTNKRWGYGYDHDRLDIPSFIEAACWCSNVVQFVDDNGDEWNHIRSLSHVQLNGRKVQQQVEEMCLAGRLSRPFLFNGKIHVVPLRVMTDAELAAAPVFTETGSSPNIIHNGIRTTLTVKRTSDLELPNRIECTIDDAEDDYAERPLRPVEDIDAQLKAGRVLGDFSKKINSKKFGLAGVVVEGQGIKMATALRDLGEFDEGGLNNNLEIRFRAWIIDCLDLYQTKVIRMDVTRLEKYGFEYFRIKEMKRQSNLEYELVLQAYNHEYMLAFETLYGSIDPIPTDPDPPTTGTVPPPTDPLVYTTVNYTGGILNILSEATV